MITLPSQLGCQPPSAKPMEPMGLKHLTNPRQGPGVNGPIVKERFCLASEALWYTTARRASNV